jgi:antitoxin component YwqK of YwqJK toxin-antitoxin module
MKAICLLSTLFFLGAFGYVNGQETLLQNGYNKIYYPNGKVSSEGIMRNGKPDGFWKTYYPSGVLKSEGSRTNFLLDSIWVFYNEIGDTLQKVSYILGKRNGYTITYNTEPASDPMHRGKILSKELYVNDKKEGTSFSYFPSGQIKEEALFSGNKKNGISREFDNKGTLITILNYKNGFLVERERLNRKDEKGLKQGLWRDYYENGDIKSEAYYENDLLTGSYKEYDENGNIRVLLQYAKGTIVEDQDTAALEIDIRNTYDDQGNLTYSGSYRNDIPVGIHRMYDNTGKVINGILYDNEGKKSGEGIITNEGKKEGEWKYYFQNGGVRASGRFVNNLETGKWNFYFENGKTEQTGVYKQGKTDGLWQWYHADGSLKREEEFFEGKPEGIYVEYDTAGQIMVSGKYFDGQMEEEWVYKVGDYMEKGKYVADLRDGKWEAFYADGKLKYEGNFIQGNPDGEHKFYFPNGQLKEINYYVMGISEKNWRKYDENGTLLLTITYRDNQEYRINGEKVDFAEDDKKLIQ